jgi:type II secretory pathway pseudopilin PulG
LVEIMVVVVIIGLLAAMGLPALRRVKMRTQASAVQNDLKTFSTAFITFNLQNGHWPANELASATIPAELGNALTNNFTLKSPIGGYYKWNYDVAADGITAKAAIVIMSEADSPVSDDEELRLLIDRQIDDGVLTTGNVQLGATNSLVYIIEK